ncbi:unnamed protein product [Musa banksii]
MESDNIECISVSDGMVDDDEVAPVPHPFLKPHGDGSGTVIGCAGGFPAPVISPVTRVHQLLECPVCTNSMYPPIHQCHNGHTLCSACKSRVHNRCPTCRQELGDIRCLALEKVAESLDLPCRYFSLGCPESFPYYSKLKHEAQCDFRPYNCPDAGSECSVVRDIPFLVAHLREEHQVFHCRFMGDENEAMHYGCKETYVRRHPSEQS